MLQAAQAAGSRRAHTRGGPTVPTRLLLAIAAAAMLLVACGDDDDTDTTDSNGGTSDATSESTADRTAATRTTEPEDTSVFDLAVGDCFNDVAQGQFEATEVPIVPCDEPHDNEIYFEYEIDGDDFPGADVVEQDSFARCEEEFEAFVGTPPADSELSAFPIYPTEQSWANGDRVVYCAVYATDLSKLTGSVEGSDR
jgi:hypothetical protein